MTIFVFVYAILSVPGSTYYERSEFLINHTKSAFNCARLFSISQKILASYPKFIQKKKSNKTMSIDIHNQFMSKTNNCVIRLIGKIRRFYLQMKFYY